MATLIPLLIPSVISNYLIFPFTTDICGLEGSYGNNCIWFFFLLIIDSLSVMLGTHSVVEKGESFSRNCKIAINKMVLRVIE